MVKRDLSDIDSESSNYNYEYPYEPREYSKGKKKSYDQRIFESLSKEKQEQILKARYDNKMLRDQWNKIKKEGIVFRDDALKSRLSNMIRRAG